MARGGSGPNGSGGGGSVTPIGDVVNVVGVTTDAYAEVFSAVQPSGLIGTGTIENTDAETLTVKETAVDKFGITAFVETTIAPGDAYLLNPQSNFDDGVNPPALPPYTEYTVEVKSTTPGSPTTYELHYIDVAPGSGPGLSGGPPGTWTKVGSGRVSLGPGTTTTLVTAPLPLAATFIYVPFLTYDVPGVGSISLSQGNILAAPPAGAIFYALANSGGNIGLIVRSSGSAPPCDINWVLYKVVP